MRKSVYRLLFIILLICFCSRTGYVSVNQKTSACKGFKELSKRSAISYKQDSLDYCEDEKIRWSYDKTAGILSLLHTRQLDNCAAELEMYIKNDGNLYTIETHDESDPNAQTDCMCYFDTYCELEEIHDSTITILYGKNNYPIYLNEIKGVIELQVNASWPCLEY